MLWFCGHPLKAKAMRNCKVNDFLMAIGALVFSTKSSHSRRRAYLKRTLQSKNPSSKHAELCGSERPCSHNSSCGRFFKVNSSSCSRLFEAF